MTNFEDDFDQSDDISEKEFGGFDKKAKDSSPAVKTEKAEEKPLSEIEEPTQIQTAKSQPEPEITEENIENVETKMDSDSIEESEPKSESINKIAEETAEMTDDEPEEENVTENVIEETYEKVEQEQVKQSRTSRKQTAQHAPASEDDTEENLVLKTLDEVMHESMIPYSEFVIMDRALPRIEDGLKPVQRRILFAMYEMGLEPDKPFRKSAGIVGECLGKYHPHGDSSVYAAMVRLAQPFNMNMPLVLGQGNFGSDDGDPAAAMRYTEAKLDPLALELLRDIDKETVPFSLTFDDRNTEPDVLPGRYPNLLVNGATGIAVGLATNIPPHNLGEVIDAVIAMIDSPRITLKEIMKIIKGPDFPSSAYVLGGEDLIRAYETGRGKVGMRAKVHIEIADNGNKSIVINDLPYQVNKVTLQQRIALIREEKKGILSNIGEIRDESDRKGTRIVIRVKREADPKAICDLLFRYTDLQCNFNINMVAIAGGKPLQLGLLEILHYYVDFQRDVILKRSKFELEAAKEKAHILEGLLIAIKNIDEVVKIIKTSKTTTEAKQRLRDRFHLSERQAQAILDLRLARLTSLEVYKLEEELKELHVAIARLTEIVNSKKLQLDVVKTELLEIKKKHRVDRRSKVIFSLDQAVVTADDDAAPVNDVVISYGANGCIKSVTQKSFGMSQTTFSDKSSLNEISKVLLATSTDKILYIFTNMGNCYKLDAGLVPDAKWKEKGLLFKTVVKESLEGENPVAMFALDGENLPKGDLVFLTKMGMIKKSKWSEYGILKGIFQAVKLNEGDEVIALEEDAENTSIMFVTKQGMTLNAVKDDVPYQGRVAGGVRGINLNDGDYCLFAGQVSKQGDMVVCTADGLIKKVQISEIEPMARYRKGVKIAHTEIKFADYSQDEQTIVAENDDGTLVGMNTKSIMQDGRTGKGKKFKGISAKFKAVYTYKNKI